MKAKTVMDSDGDFYGIKYLCPGCVNGPYENAPGYHVLPVNWAPEDMKQSDIPTTARWGFNGNFEQPTFSPSVLSWGGKREAPTFVCHSFVEDGFIRFLDDCTHPLKGQRIEMPQLEMNDDDC